MGIGIIFNVVLVVMKNYKELGIYIEMFFDGVIELVEKGVIINQYKVKYCNYIVMGFLMGI